MVLFDIDGTLLTSARAGRRALREAFAAEFDELTFFDSVPFDGKTDRQIVIELHQAAGASDRCTPPRVEQVLQRYLGHLERILLDDRQRVVPCAGVPQLLDALEHRDDILLGLLTGNIVPGARLKLEAAGISFERFRLGAFGSDSEHRPDLPAIAAERATALFGRRPVREELVIIGDTPADVSCGASVGARAIAVATGSYSAQQLALTDAYAVFPTLSDTAAVMQAILA